jgi:hypothetical protein
VNGENDSRVEGATRAAVAALALLQAVFTALGAINGGLSAVAINNSEAFVASLVVITVGFVLLALAGALNRAAGAWAKVATGSLFLGMTLLASGVAVTAYAAIVVPTTSSSPTVDVEVVATDPLVLRAEVAATGIKRGEPFQVLAEGYEEYGGEYHYRPPLLYHAVLGADSSGEVASTFEFAVPPGKYDAVGIDAWPGSLSPPGPCGFSREHPHELGFPRSEITQIGCAVVRVAGLGGAPR